MPVTPSLADDILERVRGVLPPGRGHYALHEPVFEGREWEYVKKCLDTGWVSYAGAYVQELDYRLAKTCGVDHAVCMVNGTAALQIALMVAGVNPGDEILVPTLTFVASANAIVHAGAIPHFVDSEDSTLGVDAQKLRAYLQKITRKDDGACVNTATGRRIAAIVPVHIFGHPCDMDAVMSVAKDFGLRVVTDAAESLGSLYKNKPAASYGDIAVLSFNGNKTITTGGGGAIVTDDESMAARARHLTTTAKVKHAWKFFHDETGYNLRMPNINAALGCAGLEYLDDLVNRKRALAEQYIAAFSDVSDVSVFPEPANARSNYWLNALMLDDQHAGQRDMILDRLNAAGIQARPVWELMHTLPMYKNNPRMDVSCAETLAARIVNVPSSPYLIAQDRP